VVFAAAKGERARVTVTVDAAPRAIPGSKQKRDLALVVPAARTMLGFLPEARFIQDREAVVAGRPARFFEVAFVHGGESYLRKQWVIDGSGGHLGYFALTGPAALLDERADETAAAMLDTFNLQGGGVMKRILSTTALAALCLVLRHEPAEAVCGSGTRFSVLLGDKDNPTACSGAPKVGCKEYRCDDGTLSGWATGDPTCTTPASCAENCTLDECIELCANARDDDGDGVADDGCGTLPAMACTVPAGCQAQAGTSLSAGTVVLREGPDWDLPRVGPALAFRRTHVSRAGGGRSRRAAPTRRASATASCTTSWRGGTRPRRCWRPSRARTCSSRTPAAARGVRPAPRRSSSPRAPMGTRRTTCVSSPARPAGSFASFRAASFSSTTRGS
jgi:hypothetical protein